LHASPRWRTRAELHWVHAVVRHVHVSVPQAVVAIERWGRTTFEWDGRLLALFPFIDGSTLDREDAKLRKQAARLLAGIHTGLLDWTAGPRPAPSERAPAFPTKPADLDDPDLDVWWEGVRDQEWVEGPTHGDYYRRNLLCANREIVGIIDWHDAEVRPLAVELAGATFELCRDDEHLLDTGRAEEFLASYRDAGGPVPDRDIEMLGPLMRTWIRNDVLGSLASGGDASSDYIAKQIRAFRSLGTGDMV